MDFDGPEKLGVIVFPSAGIKPEVPDELRLTEEFWSVRSVPGAIEDHWKEWVGSVMMEKIERSDFSLISRGESANPEILDDENKLRGTRVHCLFIGLQVAAQLTTSEDPITLSVGVTEERFNVRQVSTVGKLPMVPGAPQVSVGVANFQEAASIADLLLSLPRVDAFNRLNVVINAFQLAMQSYNPEERLHQLVRTIEGLLHLPRNGGGPAFRERVQLFIGPGHDDRMRRLYELRSAVEHMNDPLPLLDGATVPEKQKKLFRELFETEAVARFALRRVLSDRALAEHFRTHQGLDQFWTQGADARRAQFGNHLDLPTVRGEYSEAYRAEDIF